MPFPHELPDHLFVIFELIVGEKYVLRQVDYGQGDNQVTLRFDFPDDFHVQITIHSENIGNDMELTKRAHEVRILRERHLQEVEKPA